MATYNRPGVYISERVLPAPVAVTASANAAGAVSGVFASGPTTTTLVSSWYEFTKNFGGYNALYPATFQIGAFFKNGGRDLYVKRVVASDSTAAAAVVGRASLAAGTVVTFTAKAVGTDGNNLRVKLQAGTLGTGYYDVLVYKEGVAGTSSDVTNDVLLESYENVVLTSTTSSDYMATVINAVSTYITVTVGDNANAPALAVYPLATGSNGSAVTLTDFQSVNTGTITAFDNIDRPLVVFLPALADAITATNAATHTLEVIGWAASKGIHFVVADTVSGRTVAQALTVATTLAGSSHAAIYYPNYYITDPVGRSASSIRLIGPAGAMAGIYMNTDATFGPFKAPAGIGTTVQGAISLEKAFTSTELDSLNGASAPVNAIRQLPGAGISVMGARTLKNDGTANRYVNMRRSLIYIRKRLNDLTQFALFENNDEKLWQRINAGLGTFLNEYYNQGGLRGTSPGEAFFIKCDAENNPDNLIAQGQVNIEVGVALQYPAEFIVIALSQKTVNS
jgi:phage tail sheath protein FI